MITPKEEDDTFLDFLEKNPDVMTMMVQMPDSANRSLVTERRKELFSFLWETDLIPRTEVLKEIEESEDYFVDMVNEEWDIAGNIPDWILRCEAQSIKLQRFHNKFEEEGLLET